jgi:hypothetical protein
MDKRLIGRWQTFKASGQFGRGFAQDHPLIRIIDENNVLVATKDKLDNWIVNPVTCKIETAKEGDNCITEMGVTKYRITLFDKMEMEIIEVEKRFFYTLKKLPEK